MSNGTICCAIESCCQPPPRPSYSATEDEWREYGLRVREWLHKKIEAVTRDLMREAGMERGAAHAAAVYLVENDRHRIVPPHFIGDIQGAIDNGVLRMPRESGA